MYKEKLETLTRQKEQLEALLESGCISPDMYNSRIQSLNDCVKYFEVKQKAAAK